MDQKQKAEYLLFLVLTSGLLYNSSWCISKQCRSAAKLPDEPVKPGFIYDHLTDNQITTTVSGLNSTFTAG